MQNQKEIIPALLLSIVDNQTLLAEAVTRLANEALDGEGIRELALAVTENNEVITKALQELANKDH